MKKSVQGIKKFLLWRFLKDAATKPGTKIALQTEHETTSTRDANTTPTKDGGIKSLGAIEQEISATFYLAHTDEVDRLKDAQEQGEIIEVWDVIADNPDTEGKYKATYYQVYVAEIGETAPTDDGVEVSVTLAVEGYGKRGRTPLTEEQEQVLDYIFVEATAGTVQPTETVPEPVTPEG